MEAVTGIMGLCAVIFARKTSRTGAARLAQNAEGAMRRTLISLAILALTACAGGVVPPLLLRGEPPTAASGANIAAALADSRRPEADIARDALRQPAEIMAFAGVSEGWRIADIGPGGGYYSRLFAVAVGDTGRVYAVDRPPSAERPRPMSAVAAEYANITHLTDGYQGWTIAEPLDAIFISQIYHDFFLPQLGIDVPALNRAMFAALKPGGVLVIIDHAAVDGSDISVTNTLHRIDRAQVVRDMEAAGFVLEAESDVLRNRADNRTERVFEADIRGHTDQFALRFRKPS
jgi:predicted methyltransferase